MADQDYSNMSRDDLLREVEMMRKALRVTQDSINAGLGGDYAQRVLKDTAQRQRNLLADQFMSPQGAFLPQFAGRNATQNLKVWDAFQKAQQQQALQDTPQELLEDVDFKDLVELFGKAFGPGEDMQNLGQGLWQAGKQAVMSPTGPGGMLKNLIDLLKQVGTRRERHFPETYRQRNYDVILPDESGFQWPELNPELKSEPYYPREPYDPRR